jgi:hypothetical protein
VIDFTFTGEHFVQSKTTTRDDLNKEVGIIFFRRIIPIFLKDRIFSFVFRHVFWVWRDANREIGHDINQHWEFHCCNGLWDGELFGWEARRETTQGEGVVLSAANGDADFVFKHDEAVNFPAVFIEFHGEESCQGFSLCVRQFDPRGFALEGDGIG